MMQIETYDIKDKIQKNINNDSGLCKNLPNCVVRIIRYIGDKSYASTTYEKDSNNESMQKTKYIPDITIDQIAILLNSFELFSIGIMKYNTQNPLKAKILVLPDKNISFAPLPSIGNILLNSNWGAVKKKVTPKLINTIVVIIVVVFIITLLPIRFASSATNKNTIITR